MNKINGSCSCGEIQYEMLGELVDVAYCHCSQCRRTLGAAFGAYARVKSDEFFWLSILSGNMLTMMTPFQRGEEKTSRFHMSTKGRRSKDIRLPVITRYRMISRWKRGVKNEYRCQIVTTRSDIRKPDNNLSHYNY